MTKKGQKFGLKLDIFSDCTLKKITGKNLAYPEILFTKKAL